MEKSLVQPKPISVYSSLIYLIAVGLIAGSLCIYLLRVWTSLSGLN